MDDKLQVLTQKLFNEGVEKGEARSMELIRDAELRAVKALEDANTQAALILEQARRESDDLKKRVEGEIKLASRQALSEVRQAIEAAVMAKAVTGPITQSLSDPAYLRDLIKAVAETFKPATGAAPDLTVVLPESKKADLEKALGASLGQALGSGITVRFTRDIKAGFQVAPDKGGFKVGFTDEDFAEYFKGLLRPATRKYMFNE